MDVSVEHRFRGKPSLSFVHEDEGWFASEPVFSTWPHLNSDVGLEEGEY